MKKKVLMIIGLALMLSACNGERKIVQPMVIRSNDSTKTMLLLQATERVMNRRLAAVSVKNAHASVTPTSDKTAMLTLTLPDDAAEKKAKAILREPFFFDLRIEKPKTDESGDNQKTSDWIPTALTGSNLAWVQSSQDKSENVSIELQFTGSGREILKSIFQNNVGKHIGIFVRDLLVSKLTIASAKVSDRVVISGIPSAKVAEIFADDVIVGLFVDFTPAP